jgi:co-chaperonin GroES (HSP10)
MHSGKKFHPKQTYIQVEIIGSVQSAIIDLSALKEKPCRGRIMAIGPGVDPEAVKVGDVVSFSPQLKYPNIEFDWKNARTRVIQQADIEFVIEDFDDVAA